MADVFVFGVAVADFVMGVDHFPSGGGKSRAGEATIVGGGCAANAAVAVARLGGTARLAARLGDDPVGDMIAGDLAAEGVDLSLINRATGGRSSFSTILVDEQGERQIVNFRGDGLVEDPGWIASALKADAVLVDTRWPPGALAALRLARDWGVPGVLDAEAPVDRDLIAAASHVAFARPALASLDPDPDPARALARLAATTDAWLAVTDGGNGVWFTENGDIAHMPGFEVPVADTLGAGDLWHGAFALALAEGQSEREGVRFANAVAAIKCTVFGGRTGCPDRQATEEFLREGRLWN